MIKKPNKTVKKIIINVIIATGAFIGGQVSQKNESVGKFIEQVINIVGTGLAADSIPQTYETQI